MQLHTGPHKALNVWEHTVDSVSSRRQHVSLNQLPWTGGFTKIVAHACTLAAVELFCIIIDSHGLSAWQLFVAHCSLASCHSKRC